MLKIRRSHDRLIFNMGISIPGKHGLYIETGPWVQLTQLTTGYIAAHLPLLYARVHTGCNKKQTNKKGSKKHFHKHQVSIAMIIPPYLMICVHTCIQYPVDSVYRPSQKDKCAEQIQYACC